MYTFISGLLLLLLLTASQHPVHTGQSEINYIHSIIKRAHQERPIETLVYVKRRHDLCCHLNEIKSVGLATLRMDERTMFSVKGLYNSQALALVCLSELADVLLLPNLAQNFDRMRDARIIILLRTTSSYLPDFLRLISEQANNYSFVNIIVLHSESEVYNPIVAYRLQPFPTPSFSLVLDMNVGEIFPLTCMKFNNKTAIYFPDLIAPQSLLITNPRTGEQKLAGSSDIFTMEFARKHNIRLQWLMPLSEVGQIDFTDVLQFTKQGLIDLPTHPFVHRIQSLPANLEYDGLSDENLLILVPCAKQMRTGEVIRGMRTYFIIVLVAYFLFSLLEALTAVASFRIIGIRKLGYFDLILNLRTFAAVLGRSTTKRSFSSISMQQIVIITSVFSLVFTTFFEANLSTLLTKHPHYREIGSFHELRESGIPVVIDRGLKRIVSMQLDTDKNFSNLKYLPTKEVNRLVMSFNSSYAYLAPSYLWNLANYYQKSHNRIVFCRPPGLKFLKITRFQSVLKRNSVFSKAYTDFLKDMFRFGLDEYWESQAAQKMMSTAFYSDKNSAEQDVNSIPLSFSDLKWLWKLLGVCYIVAGFVWIAEVCIARWQNKRAKTDGIIEEFVV